MSNDDYDDIKGLLISIIDQVHNDDNEGTAVINSNVKANTNVDSSSNVDVDSSSTNVDVDSSSTNVEATTTVHSSTTVKASTNVDSNIDVEAITNVDSTNVEAGTNVETSTIVDSITITTATPSARKRILSSSLSSSLSLGVPRRKVISLTYHMNLINNDTIRLLGMISIAILC